MSALPDTAALKLNGDVIVPTELATKLPLGPKETETILSDAAGHKYPSFTAKLNGDLVLGEVSIHNPTVLVSDWLGVIDLAAMSNQFALTIDLVNHRIRVSRPDSTPLR
jgi:hypothetical protein